MVQTARFELANPKILHIGAVSTQLLPAYCSLRAEPKPRPSGKEGGKEKNGRCRVCPCIPTLSHFFLLLHFVVQHHLISAFTYGAYSSFIAHSFSGQYRQFLAKGHSRRSALDIQRDTVDVLTPKCLAIALIRQPHSKYSLRYSTVCSFTLQPPPGRMSPAPRRTPPRCTAPSDAHTPPCHCEQETAFHRWHQSLGTRSAAS